MIFSILYILAETTETTSLYLLCCRNFSSTRSALMNDPNLIDLTISELNETALANILLYGDSKKSTSENSKILQSTRSRRFVYYCPLLPPLSYMG